MIVCISLLIFYPYLTNPWSHTENSSECKNYTFHKKKQDRMHYINKEVECLEASQISEYY